MLNILVTGAGGQLGCELRKLGATSENNYIYTDVDILDITDGDAVAAFADGHAIDIIVNCAAYTDVERAEDDEQTAYSINCTAVGNLAATAAKRNALLIHISTDYVFDGRSCKPYTEDMPTAPLNAYGRTKRAGEQAIAESGCRYIILRTAWLYSGFGNNFLKTMLRLTSERKELNVVADQTGSPTYAADLAEAVFDIIENGKYACRDGIYHFTDEGECSWYDFACAIAAEAGNDACRINPCRSCDYPAKAVRPARSVLDKSKFKHIFGRDIPHWQEAMRRCIQQIKNKAE